MPVTLEDVAKIAGVSHTTVSLVLHNDKKISGATREKVMKAIEELKYQPNIHARTLACGKTNTIAILSSFFSSSFATEIMKGIEDEIIMTEYDIHQYSTRGDKEKVIKHIDSIVYGRRADGLIVMSLLPERKQLDECVQNNMPVVLIERQIDGFSSVRTDNEKGAYMAGSHLIKTGRKKIVFVCGRIDCYDCINAKERHNGFKRALRDGGMEFRESEAVYTWYDFNDGVRVMSELLDSKRDMDAVFCASGDMVALGMIKEARNRGIRIPQDIAFVGYDDILASSIATPQLTTVRQPIAKMGKEALDMMMRTINKDIKEPVVTTFEPELVVRESA